MAVFEYALISNRKDVLNTLIANTGDPSHKINLTHVENRQLGEKNIPQ